MKLHLYSVIYHREKFLKSDKPSEFEHKNIVGKNYENSINFYPAEANMGYNIYPNYWPRFLGKEFKWTCYTIEFLSQEGR